MGENGGDKTAINDCASKPCVKELLHPDPASPPLTADTAHCPLNKSVEVHPESGSVMSIRTIPRGRISAQNYYQVNG